MALTDRATDEELVAQYRGSHAGVALEQLVRRHVPKVRAAIFQMVLDDDIADDLTQETMLRAVRALGDFEGRSKFSTWLYRVAMNTAKGYLLRNRRSPVLFQSECVEQSSLGATPDQAAVEAELLAETERAIAALSPKLRASIVLTALQGLSPREAAEIENCTESTMYWRVHEARQQLKHRLREHLS
jgi:RNA polymerase sigma-70 factor (ECF subfamily)